jgi:hypothetical protein
MTPNHPSRTTERTIATNVATRWRVG